MVIHMFQKSMLFDTRNGNKLERNTINMKKLLRPVAISNISLHENTFYITN